MPSVIRLGLIGAGIQQSAAPALHKHEAAEHGIACTYELIDLDVLGVDATALPGLLSDAEARGFRGVNITHPCKQAAISCLDDLSEEAKILNAVNTVVFADGKRFGHNTDWWGFAQAFRRNLSDAPSGAIVQLGAGGAGSAVAYALLTLGAGQLTIFDLDADRAASLAGNLKRHFPAANITAGANVIESLSAADGLVNATPVGMAKYRGTPVPERCIRHDLWVADIVYVPLDTALLKAARAAGCKTMGGGDMAIYQAVEAFRLFHGVMADSDRMRRLFAQLAKT
jgi:quinate/shikimate dehydrogenase (NAD+)